MTYDIIVIGGGPAGITAAVYAARAGLKVVIVEKNIYGGQTSIIENIENYPGFIKISGFDFANVLYKQATNLGIEFIFKEAVELNFVNETKEVMLSGGEKIYSKAIIVANGLKRRKLGCVGEKEFSGKGVSYCATCDGAFFKGKSAIVVGGGNTALEDALYLSKICKKVTLVVRKNNFRAEKILSDAVKSNSNIDIMFESSVKEITGDKVVNKVILESAGEEKTLSVDVVFIAIGYQPNNEMYRGKIDMDEKGYFCCEEDCKTNEPGIYVAGDCRIKPLRQIATAVSDGAVAGNAAAAYVQNHIK